MEMKDAIIARRSVRSYTGQPLDGLLIDSLAGFISDIRPLHDNIPVDVMLYEKEDFHKEFGRSSMYRATDFVVIRSAMSVQGYLQNAGFIGEQIALWLTHKGIASCWAGMAKQKSQPSRGELPYIISIEFGRGNNAPSVGLPRRFLAKSCMNFCSARSADRNFCRCSKPEGWLRRRSICSR